ncbi:MAG: EVE domain-containing protein [Archangium gephyra]|uniref:EVE domain-containing protein n=1 Tax=Archangium gephyra TaxID=48 RepID=A0A2W5VKR0_9BACT|nr:MAG: EVE domain-containing protein [Archangium gephyra]
MPKRYWLVKSEPDVYSIDALKKDGHTGWTGVRNYTARNFMRDSMQEGDLVLYYHSNAEPSGVAGLAKVHGAPLPDPTQFDKKSEYYDATSDKAEPRWVMAQLSFVEKFAKLIPLDVLKADPSLTGMPLLAKGQRLSVMPVAPEHFARVLKLAGSKVKA